MKFELLFTKIADEQLSHLEQSKGSKIPLKAVCKTLGLMEVNLRHPGINTHEYSALQGANGEKVFESYAQNHTSGAYRIFWHYGPRKNQITVVAITRHP